MTDKELIRQLAPLHVVALTLYGEARNTNESELRAIASAILNRVKAQRRDWGLTADAVCLDPWAFSCWRAEGGERNYDAVLDAARFFLRPDYQFGPAMRRCLAVARDVVAGTLPDTVKGSTHYMTLTMWQKHPPAWAKGKTPTVIVSSSVFFAGIP
jgi:N-acetylmuramoyl-L-alanine amidase